MTQLLLVVVPHKNFKVGVVVASKDKVLIIRIILMGKVNLLVVVLLGVAVRYQVLAIRC